MYQLSTKILNADPKQIFEWVKTGKIHRYEFEAWLKHYINSLELS